MTEPDPIPGNAPDITGSPWLDESPPPPTTV